MFNQDRTISSKINYVKNGSAIVTDHLFFSYIQIKGQNTLFKTEIDKYLNDDGKI